MTEKGDPTDDSPFERMIGAGRILDAEGSESETAEALYRAMVERIPAVVYLEVPDEDNPGWFRDVYVSPQIRAWLGYSPEEWIRDSVTWTNAIYPEDLDLVTKEMQRTAETGDRYHVEYRLRTRSGGVVWVSDQAVLIRDDAGAPRYWQGLMTDVTERKKNEDLEHSLRVEREVSDELRRLSDMKDRFLAAVSHDFRSPLASIRGFASTLLRTARISDDERTEFLERISASALKLERIVNDLLDVDRLSKGVMELDARSTDVGSRVAEIVEGWGAIEDRAISVEAVSVMARADVPKLERMVENLLANAVKHTPPGTRVWVKVAEAEGGALISVEDDGPGIPDALKTTIFEPFLQAPGQGANPGVGIGLSLVKMFAELHGGTVWVGDRPLGGAAFRIFLPADPAN